MSDYTAAYTELVDKVIRDSVLNVHQQQHDTNDREPFPVTETMSAAAGRTTTADGFSDIFVAKATAMSVLFIAALCAGLIPFKLAQVFKWKQGGTETGRTGLIVSLLLAFGGGVLLCTTFLHLLPEVKENIERLQAAGALPRVGFHLAEFLMCAGFFLMYFIEQCVHAYLHGRDERRQRTGESAFRRGVSVRESASVAATTTASSATRRKKAGGSVEQRNVANGTSSVAELIENDANDLNSSGVLVATVEGMTNGTVNNGGQYLSAVVDIAPKAPLAENGNRHHHHHHHHHHGHKNGHNGHGHSHLHLPISAPSTPTSSSADKNGQLPEDDDAVVTSLRGLLIVLALSVHELFEGLAVGLESSATNVWYLFGAVAAHKLVLAFCVGVELIVARTRKWLAFGYVLTFSVVSPLGIGIGMLVSGNDGDVGTTSSGGGVVSAILQGLACGTLLYVVFFEILQKDKSGLVQLIAVLVGFFIMFGLQFISGHEHTHGDSGSHDGHSHGHGHSHEHGNAHADDDDHDVARLMMMANEHHHHQQPQSIVDPMTTAATTQFQRVLPQLVEELAGVVLAQTRQPAA